MRSGRCLPTPITFKSLLNHVNRVGTIACLWSRETVIARLAIWSLPSCLCRPGEWSLLLNVALPPKLPELASRCYPSHVLSGNAQPSFAVCFLWNVHATPGSYSSDLLPHTRNSGQGCLLKRCLSERRGGNDLNSHPWETGYRSQMEYYATIKKEWGSAHFTDMMPSPKYTVKQKQTKIQHTAQKLHIHRIALEIHARNYPKN